MSGYSLYPFVCLPFLEGEAWVGHRFEPLGCVLDFWRGWVGFKSDDIQERFLGQLQYHEYFLQRWRFTNNGKEAVVK